VERLYAFRDDVRASLWFRPGLLAAGAVAAAWVSLGLDRRVAGTPTGEALLGWAGDVDSSRQVLATIAGGMITIAGVSFSIVVVALVLASNQFSPRVLRNFTSDRVVQTVIGAFIATFLYAVLVMRGLRSGTGDGPPYVPAISVFLAIVFAVVSLGAFVYFIHHISQSIQVSRIVSNVSERTAAAIESMFEHDRAPTGPARSRSAVLPPPAPCLVSAESEGYVTRVDEEGLVRAAVEIDTVIESIVGPGDFVASGAPLALARRRPDDPESFADRVRGAFVVGPRRTIASDPSLGFRELVDVAIKALSPGINDPHTACHCIDYLGSLLRRMADRDWPEPEYVDDEGTVRLRVPAADFGDYLHLAFTEIRRYGTSDLAVSLRLFESLGGLASATHRADRREAIWKQAREVIEGADRGFDHPADRRRLEAEIARLGEAVGADPKEAGFSVRQTIEAGARQG